MLCFRNILNILVLIQDVSEFGGGASMNWKFSFMFRLNIDQLIFNKCLITF